MRLLSGLLALASLASLGQADEPTKEDLLKLEKQLKAAHANVGPAMACVVVSRSEKYPRPLRTPEPGQLGGFDRESFLKSEPTKTKLADQLDLSKPDTIPDHGFAGGVVIDASGLVLTNYTTIDGATKIYVHLPGGKGSYADIRAADSRSDLAVLKLITPPADLKTVRFARARLPDLEGDPKATVTPGKVVLIMAYPHSSGAVMDLPTAGLGNITTIRKPASKPNANTTSALFRSIYNYSPVLEYSAQFNPGVNGAAVLNLDGEVVALTASSAAIPSSDASRDYALPVDENLTRIIEVLRRGEEVEYGFLGVTKPDFPRAKGIPVEGFPTKGTPAFAAGLTPNDVITRINDRPVNTFEDLLLHVGSAQAGSKVKFRVQRGVETFEPEVTLAKFKNEAPFFATVRPEPVFGLRIDYSSMLAQTVFNPFGGRNLTELPSGVHVRELIPDSPAALKFKPLGENNRWVITSVNGTPISSPAGFYKETKGQKSLRLTVIDATDPNSRHSVTLP